ncbi:MAG TPA: cell wall-binding repeat-containing protein [Patescibacteria group bacterium]|nr:cell wall-binding repeat-containing protein [Patescibacteria group bacterium]
MLHRDRPSTSRRSWVAALGALLALSLLVPSRPASAAEPNETVGARALAERNGGAPADYVLVYEADAAVTDGSALWTGKYVDQRTGAVHVVQRDGTAGAVAGEQLHAQRMDSAAKSLTALERKGDAELRAAVVAATGRTTAAGTTATVPVGVWLQVDVAGAEAAVIARHPELEWVGDRPVVDSLEAARAIRAELWQARADARAAAAEQLRVDVARIGGSIGYLSTGAPLAYLDVPADRVAALAELPSVTTLGLERSWSTTMSSAGPGVQANWTSGTGDQGTGVRVAVVEYHNVRNSGDLSGRVVASRSTSGSIAYSPDFDHPTWVAGAIAGRSSSYPGVAPGALIVSSSTGGGPVGVARDRDIIAAADWAASPGGGDSDVVNLSIGQDTATGSEEARRYFDAMAHEDGRLPVAAAGNYVTFGHWNVLSPGTSWNALTVGGIDDRNTAGRNDDRIWYYPGSNGSNYRDPAGTAWNAHGDFNKPNVSAPAASVRTANGLGASGTSVASPIVAGIAAQVIARAPSLALRPEGTRAIIMAGAINRSPMPDGSRNADHEGTGTASAMWANRILNVGDGTWGGYRLASMTAGQVLSEEISVVAGQKIKVAVSWNSHSSGSTSSDRLMADLDLRLIGPDGSVAGSYTYDNNYEWVEITAARTGKARIEVRSTRFEASSERVGLAWAKWSVGTPNRIAGTDRYGTAAAVSRAHFGPGVPVAYVATGLNFPDALAAGPAAGIQGGPVLLTDKDRLPPATRDELARLRPGRIVVLGSTAAVSAYVGQQLQGYTSAPVQRLQGADRYATAVAVSRSAFAPGVSAAFVATGASFPDALAAGPAAIKARGPVLLTQPGSLPAATRDELKRLAPSTIYVLGGTSSVSESVRLAIAQATGKPVVRLAGADRFATAAAVSKAFFTLPPSVYLATGLNFPDALAAVPAAGRAASPLLLVQRDAIPSSVASELVRLHPPRVFLAGGTPTISDSVVSQLRALLGRP